MQIPSGNAVPQYANMQSDKQQSLGKTPDLEKFTGTEILSRRSHLQRHN
jgi:hypothetical protein